MFLYDLFLKKADKNDLKILFDLKNEVQFFHHRVAFLNETDQLNWFENIDKDVYQPKNLILIGANPDCTNENLGVLFFTNINYIHGTADLGCDIFPNFRNKGFGTRLMSSGLQFCKDILRLRKINAEVLEFNLPSQKMLIKNGFVQEGVKKEQVFKNGNFVDSIIWAKFL